MLLALYIAVTLITLGDGSEWECGGDREWQVCINTETGEVYESQSPLTDASRNAYRKSESRKYREAECACSREIHGGVNSGTGIICTGAFDPYLLRKREIDPCAGAWENRK
jgi:hypothetical protein